MKIEDKFDYITYLSYKYKNEKFDSNKTIEFFDLNFSRYLIENISDISNSQSDLLSYFDFSELFNSYTNKGLSELQTNILEFLVIKNVKGVEELLSNIPFDILDPFFTNLYYNLKNSNDRPFWFSIIIKSINDKYKYQFINKNIDNLSETEILYLIKDLYLNNKDNILYNLMQNERVKNTAISRINSPFFYEIVESLNLSNDFIFQRQNISQTIIANYSEFDMNEIKIAYCDLYFHDIPKNVLLDIKTIIDFANDDDLFKEKIGGFYNSLVKLYSFLNSDKEYTQENIKIINSFLLNKDILSELYLMCQDRFKDLVSQSVNKDFTRNIDPKLLMSSSGKKVELYNIENQTIIQSKITMLVSTIPYSNNASVFKQIYYSDKNGEIKNGRRSCSLVNESKLKSLFGGKNRITFGYKDLNERIITSATFGDGRTDGNEFRYRRGRKVKKSNYLSIDNFISQTQGHTEITVNMGRSGKVMEPSYILITEENPTQFEIDVASEFNIPIIYVDINKYEQTPDSKYSSEDYDYYNFERKDFLQEFMKEKTI